MRCNSGKSLLYIGLLAWAGWSWLAPVPTLNAQDLNTPHAIVLYVDGIIGPASDDFIVRGIAAAEASGARVVVIRLNTPGGLDTAMRHIIGAILASDVPVVTYVAPPGSRAASAGTYIVYASHVAAMAPATNLGSATPVSMSPAGIGGEPQSDRDRDDRAGDEAPDENTGEKFPRLNSPMERKVVNDAVAYIKGLARLRGRNEQWAEAAVRSAVNLTAEDALADNVIDVVATDLMDLLTQIDGRVVQINGADLTLRTADVAVEIVEPDWRTRILDVITRPNVAYVLMFLGIYGLFFELSNPGAILPGVLGAVCLLVALYAFQVLPVNYAGLALIAVGLVFMAAELFVPSFGVLGIGGAVAFIIGSVILMDTDIAALQISLPLILLVTALTALFAFAVITLALRQRNKPVVSGREQMIGGVATALMDFDGEGAVRIHGERWTAFAERPVREHQSVRVRAINGLVLIVEPVEETS